MPFHDYSTFPVGTPIAGYVNNNGDPPNWEITDIIGVNYITLPFYADTDFILFQNELFTSASLTFKCNAGGFGATSIGLVMNSVLIFSAVKNVSGSYSIIYGNNSVPEFYPSGDQNALTCSVVITGQTATTTVTAPDTGQFLGEFSFTFADPFAAGLFKISINGYPGLISGFIYRLGWEEITPFAPIQGGNNMNVVNANSVTFSKNTKLKLAQYGTARAALILMGLLGQGLTVNAEQTLREKKDGFPEVIVASAIQAHALSLEAQLREWRKETIMPAFGMINSDITTTAGTDLAIVDEAVTFNANGIGLLSKSIKAATLPIVTGVGGAPLYAVTDYTLISRDLEGRSLLVRTPASTISALETVKVDYTHARVAMDSYAIGDNNRPTRYYAVELEEQFTNGETVKLFIPKATISLRGGLNFNVVDTGAELGIRVVGVKDPAFAGIGILEHFSAA
jgi:hypothetical protein